MKKAKLSELIYLPLLIIISINNGWAIPIEDNDQPISKKVKHSESSKHDVTGAWLLVKTSNGTSGILFINISPQGGIGASFNASNDGTDAEERCQGEKRGTSVNLVCTVVRPSNGWSAHSFMLEVDGAQLKGQLLTGSRQEDVLLLRNEEVKRRKVQAAEEEKRREVEEKHRKVQAVAEEKRRMEQAYTEEKRRMEQAYTEEKRRKELAAFIFANRILDKMVSIPGKNYELGKNDVTQSEWDAVMGSNPSFSSTCSDSDNCPLEHVSWNDIQEFLQKLNAITGKQYRLPTEAEWEFACYGGNKTEYCGSNDIDSVAWYQGNSNSRAHPVGQKQANGCGLYDMSGNVWQWMQDKYDNEHDWRVVRGGYWNSGPQSGSATSRNKFEPSSRLNVSGFRLARTIP